MLNSIHISHFLSAEALAATLTTRKSSCSQNTIFFIFDLFWKIANSSSFGPLFHDLPTSVKHLQASFLNCNQRETLFHWSSLPWQIWFKAVLNIPKLKLLDHPSIQAWSFICFITKHPNHHCSSTALQIWWVFEFLHLPNCDTL